MSTGVTVKNAVFWDHIVLVWFKFVGVSEEPATF